MSDEMDVVVEDAVNDAYGSDTSVTDTSSEISATTSDTSVSFETPQETSSTGQVGETTQTDAEAQVDEFSKRFGIPSQSVTGRENRIPYSRVKKIVQKAQQDEAARLTKDFETKFGTEKLKPLEVKIQDYETRLQKVAQFEQVMENDPQTFLNMLSRLPAYKQFFDWVNQATQGNQQPDQTSQTQQQPVGNEPMPQPDQTLSDGSKVYSMEGLQKLLDWQANQTRTRAVQEAEERITKRYAPIEQRWEQEQRMAQYVPQIERQITEARKWDKFQELEPQIIEALRTDRNLSLEGAYIRAYNGAVASERERLATDHNKVRSQVLEEIRRKPVATSAPGSAIRAVPKQQAGPRDMNDVVRQALIDKGLINGQ